MTELALNILDVANNSTAANAKTVTIKIDADTNLNRLIIAIIDDGKGMSKEFLSDVLNPFKTSRTTRRVGMGLPLLKMAAELTGGSLNIESQLGQGTTVKAEFVLNSIDRPPLGDVGMTMMTLIGGFKDIEFLFSYTLNGNSYAFNTHEVKEVLGEDDLTDADILLYLKAMINENIETVNGGNII